MTAEETPREVTSPQCVKSLNLLSEGNRAHKQASKQEGFKQTQEGRLGGEGAKQGSSMQEKK